VSTGIIIVEEMLAGKIPHCRMETRLIDTIAEMLPLETLKKDIC
jgi:hypothetical protein